MIKSRYAVNGWFSYIWVDRSGCKNGVGTRNTQFWTLNCMSFPNPSVDTSVWCKKQKLESWRCWSAGLEMDLQKIELSQFFICSKHAIPTWRIQQPQFGFPLQTAQRLHSLQATSTKKRWRTVPTAGIELACHGGGLRQCKESFKKKTCFFIRPAYTLIRAAFFLQFSWNAHRIFVIRPLSRLNLTWSWYGPGLTTFNKIDHKHTAYCI